MPCSSRGTPRVELAFPPFPGSPEALSDRGGVPAGPFPFANPSPAQSPGECSMLKRFLCAGLALSALTVCLPRATSDEALKSGPQVGQEMPGPFHLLNLTGAAAGQRKCLYCEFGT